MSNIDVVFLSNKERSVISEWNCQIVLHNCKRIHEDMIVIPSVSPSNKVCQREWLALHS